MSQPRPYVIPARRRDYDTTPPTTTTTTTNPTKTAADNKNNNKIRVDNKTPPARAPLSPPTRPIRSLSSFRENRDMWTAMMRMLAKSGRFGAPGQVWVNSKWVDRREVQPVWLVDGRRMNRRELAEWTAEQIRLLRESMFPKST